VPFGSLVGDFSRLFGGLWGFAGCHSLSSENLYFQVWEVPGRHFFVHFSRSGFLGMFLSFFMRKYVILEPFRVPFGSLWTSLFKGISDSVQDR